MEVEGQKESQTHLMAFQFLQALNTSQLEWDLWMSFMFWAPETLRPALKVEDVSSLGFASPKVIWKKKERKEYSKNGGDKISGVNQINVRDLRSKLSLWEGGRGGRNEEISCWLLPGEWRWSLISLKVIPNPTGSVKPWNPSHHMVADAFCLYKNSDKFMWSVVTRLQELTCSRHSGEPINDIIVS